MSYPLNMLTYAYPYMHMVQIKKKTCYKIIKIKATKRNHLTPHKIATIKKKKKKRAYKDVGKRNPYAFWMGI